jgi:hypothetical protein
MHHLESARRVPVAPTDPAEDPADTTLTGGRVLTFDDASSVREAIAVVS